MSLRFPIRSTSMESIPSESEAWQRNPSWPTLPEPTVADQEFVGLHAVYPQGNNYCALSCAGAYTVDWGDGTAPENVATGVTALHLYDYDDADLADTNAPVTLTDAGDLVQRAAHGYSNGQVVQFYNIVSTTGLIEDASYYVINATINAFQVALEPDGSAVTLTTDGTATLLPYKIARVTVTMQGAANMTSLNLNIRHTSLPAVTYATGWLDIAVASANLATLRIGVSTAPTTRLVTHPQLERANIVESAITSAAGLFYGCESLSKLVSLSTGAVTSFENTFLDCRSLVELPNAIDTSSALSTRRMFSGCHMLEQVPAMTTSLVTACDYMFAKCYRLIEIPELDTGNSTTFVQFAIECHRLVSFPALDTSSGLLFGSMFQECSGLQSIPWFDTSNGTDFDQMFYLCSSLTATPDIDFSGQSAASVGRIFYACSALKTVGVVDLSLATGSNNLFDACSSLQSIQTIDVSASTDLASLFANCQSLRYIGLVGAKVSVTIPPPWITRENLEEIFEDLGAGVTAQTITVTNNIGVDTAVVKASIANPTAQSTVVLINNTASLVVGMMPTGTGSPITTSAATTSDVALETLNLVSHGLQNGDRVYVVSDGTTTGLTFNTPYYVVNAAADSFQLSLTQGGAVVPLAGSNATVNIRYHTEIASINPNVSVTLTRPAATTAVNTTWTFRHLKTSIATLKGWSVTT